MQNSSRFFNNANCEYFPCHVQPAPTLFNCLFCYCPLYALGAECGGIFEYHETGLKMCQDCHLPHMPDFYDFVLEKFTTENLVRIGGNF